MTAFVKALADVAYQLNLDSAAFIKFAAEDTLPGYYDGGGEHAIPYAVDGQLLYALIRALKPARVLEIGTARGGSARHILEALHKNRRGRLITVDINPTATLAGIPDHLRERVTLVHENAELWLNAQMAAGGFVPFDFIHEDGAHSAHLVHAIYNTLPVTLAPNGVIVSHDVGTGVKDDILQGITSAGFPIPPCYVYDGSPCGFSVMQYKGQPA